MGSRGILIVAYNDAQLFQQMVHAPFNLVADRSNIVQWNKFLLAELVTKLDVSTT